MSFATSGTTSCGTTTSTTLSSHVSIPSSDDSSRSNLVPEDDNPLVPPSSDVSRTYCDGEETWAFFLAKAHDMAPGLWPVDSVNPYISLSDVPALPSSLPQAEFLYGRPMWEMRGCEAGQHDMWTSQLVPGRRVDVLLRISKPNRCDLVSKPASCYLGINSKVANSLAVLTLCWSYILSVRLLELQGRKVWYTKHRLWPRWIQERNKPAVYLDGASSALVRWLSGILCSDFGWRTEGKGLPPWAIVLSGDVLLATSDKPSTTPDAAPPNSDEATRLLVELCRLLNLGSDASGNGWESLPAYTAGFLAALMIPYYKEMRLRPQFPVPHLTVPRTSSFSARCEANIHQYARDLRYFMTLSMHPPSLGSALWSVFWQPDVECHLVSPWLRSVSVSLEPVMKALQLEILVKTFASRRPRVALWWLALFLLGDLSVVSWIRRYANKLTEKYAFASLSSPDPIFAAWTGTKQSFLDETPNLAGATPGKVSRADLLRFRFNFKLQESGSVTLAWRPFGLVDKFDVEVDLWPCLDAKCLRSYHSFLWYISQEPSWKSFPASFGFRQDTKRCVKHVHDDLDLHSSREEAHLACSPEMKLAPSKTCTLQMLSLSVEDAAGNRHIANAAMPNLHANRWLGSWGGLRTFETPLLQEDNAREEPTQFLLEWLERVQGESRRYQIEEASLVDKIQA
ncbi:hypothetical protein HIM_12381 [Hirsutella minnesotensis 3608]|uniref:Uncharacterized protein n=1 Tax=Hirsutella minnesotensis 3608 TaxID=1043627 RepID=A0A0F7ZI38_9HYPO|nr:hypothetical protein HIM_12381 [Hirsutella minnesotensis 3608]